MKTLQTGSGKAAKTAHHELKPQPEPVTWHKATLPQIGRREAARAADEWRPGDSGKRGYEQAVADWWWL